jgi:hypothetical protein
MDYDFKLSIWQTEGCARCGACCYAPGISKGDIQKTRNSLCEHLRVDSDNNTTSCELHGTDEKPEICREYSCCQNGGLPGVEIYRRAVFAKVVLDVIGIKPVPNADEIRGMLEEMKTQGQK